MKSTELENYGADLEGNIYNIKTGRKLKPDVSSGYARVTLSHSGNKKKWSIHRLIATFFIPNPFNKPCVNHKDGNKLNNHVDNLEWVTHKENERHSHKVLGKKIKHSNETKEKIRKSAIGRDMSKAREALKLKRQ